MEPFERDELFESIVMRVVRIGMTWMDSGERLGFEVACNDSRGRGDFPFRALEHSFNLMDAILNVWSRFSRWTA